MNNSIELNDDIYRLFEDTEGITVNTTITLSTTGENSGFWGTKLTLPVAKINNNGGIVVIFSPKLFFKYFKQYLEKISKPFPLLLEKLKYLECNFHGNWEDEIVKQYIDNNYKIYFCDHNH